MSEDKTYNGWTNYETWNVALWIDNDQGSQEYWLGQATVAYNQAESADSFTKDERAALDLADDLKEHFESESMDVLERARVVASMWADLLGAALSEVNWYEIAKSMIDGVDKDEVEEEEEV